MKKINNKGFTLVEILAVVIILGILIAIMIPNVNSLLKKNEEENYKKLIESIENSTRVYISDYRYEITLDNTNNCKMEGITEIGIAMIKDIEITESRVPINLLVEAGDLTTNKDGKIYNPRDKQKYLNLENSYVTVTYQCEAKDYTYKVEDESLDWINS